jgi:2-oxoisovalerate dehydrogenase E1 component
MTDRDLATPAAVDRAFTAAIEALRASPVTPFAEASAGMSPELALQIFDAQIASRHIDFAAVWLREQDAGFYTIGSAGHEGNAVVAAALRRDDPAFLHYRSGAFFLQRAAAAGHTDAIRDVLLGIVAARDEPIAGGRHKVFGSRPLWVPPQTSTIASQLPKAVGMAFSLRGGARRGLLEDLARDAVVMCSFGDASANHSTATGAINAACYIGHQNLGVPVLFVCEDNGLGISVRTPPGWIARSYGSRPGLAYFAADASDFVEAYRVAVAAVEYVRRTRHPAFLHLSVVRLLGHAGSDVALTYRSPDDIRADQARDPLVVSARRLIERGFMSVDEVLARYEDTRAQVHALAVEAMGHERLRDGQDVASVLAPRDPVQIGLEAARVTPEATRLELWGARLPERGGPLPLSGHINRCLGDLLAKYPSLLVFGEDVGKKGGVYGVTRNLARLAGPTRVFDTLLDEQTILGLAIGAGQAGFLPIPEIQYLAYLHNAEDQLRGEAATQLFFSQGQFRNPMVVRIAAYAYQRGFGGHFHNDNSVAVLRDIPGIVVASPSCGPDAAAMLRTCVAAATSAGSVCVFLEPIALYNTRDLYEDGDGLFACDYDPHAPPVPIGSARTYGDGDDLLIVSFANGVRMSRRVAARLAADGIATTVLDLRWLSPLPVDDLVAHATRVGRVVVADETRRSGGVAEGVLAALIDAGFRGPMARVTSADCFIPLGPAADHVLMNEDMIEAEARRMVGQDRAPAVTRPRANASGT